MDSNLFVGLGLIAVPLLLSLTLHEYGHARMAKAFGDPTASLMGRCTLNPLAHLDLMGTICMMFGPIGWAKPVPVDWSRLNPPRLGDIMVSLAGVGMNLILAIGCMIGLRIMTAAGVQIGEAHTPAAIGAFMLSYGLVVNLSLLFFNLIPLFPLDGHHVVRELMPRDRQYAYMHWQTTMGKYVLLALVGVPWLLRMAHAPFAFDPIGQFLGRVIYPAVEHGLGHRAFYLFIDAWAHFGPWLLWRM